MAGDWIKMRVWLAKDPRVIRMADYLAEQRQFINWLTDPVRGSCKNSAYEHVTRNVTVALCVTGLLVTWGTAREQGDRVGDDLVLQHCDKYTFDAVTDIECFGEAMEAVGWLKETENGSVTFPKFFKDNESPDEKHKRQNAERQARFRDKSNVSSNAKNNVTRNVTVTHREEKRREDIKDKNHIASSDKSLLADVVISIPIQGGEFPVRQDFVDTLSDAYPIVDVPQTLKEIKAWCLANPSKQKTARGASRFINSWCERIQNRG